MPDRRRPNIVLLVVIAIAVLAIAAVLVGGRGGDDDDATSSPATSSPSATASGAPDTAITGTGPISVTGNALPPFEGTKDDAAIGMQAPIVTGTTFAGDPVSIGKGPTLLVFVAHWCPHCQREVPLLVDWYGDSVPGGASLEGVATGIDPNRPNYPPSTWLSREKWTFPTLVDDASSTAGQAFGLTSFPYYVALDANGKVVARQSGELDRDGVEKLFEAATS